MSELNNYFDKIIWINSKKRVDRYKNMLKRFMELGITNTLRFEAVMGGSTKIKMPVNNKGRLFKNKPFPLKVGEIGCFISHREIYKIIKGKGYKRTLILEDDALFEPDFEKRFKNIVDFCNQNNYIYDMLYLGQCNYDDGYKPNCEKSKVKHLSGELWEAQRCWLTHAYAVDIRCIDYLIEKTNVIWAGIDEVLADAQKELKVLATFPNLVTQDASRSMIMQ